MQDRKLAILLYGFPPGVGATGTAALLNVPKSLERTLQALQSEGYDLGPNADQIDGEAIITALKMQEDQRAISSGASGIQSLSVLTLHLSSPALILACKVLQVSAKD